MNSYINLVIKYLQDNNAVSLEELELNKNEAFAAMMHSLNSNFATHKTAYQIAENVWLAAATGNSKSFSADLAAFFELTGESIEDYTNTDSEVTASEKAKELGCVSLAQVVAVSGQSKQTIINWFNNPKKRDLFELVCKGVSLRGNYIGR